MNTVKNKQEVPMETSSEVEIQNLKKMHSSKLVWIIYDKIGHQILCRFWKGCKEMIPTTHEHASQLRRKREHAGEPPDKWYTKALS